MAKKMIFKSRWKTLLAAAIKFLQSEISNKFDHKINPLSTVQHALKSKKERNEKLFSSRHTVQCRKIAKKQWSFHFESANQLTLIFANRETTSRKNMLLN